MSQKIIWKKLGLSLIILLICAPINIKAQSSYLINLGIIDSIYSELLMESREFYISLPESYHSNSEKEYPVIYVLDGENLLSAASIVHSYYWGGFIPEMIIVGISNSKNRTRDLTTSVIQSRHGMEYFEESGGAEIFTRFIESELIPSIESKFRASEFRTLIGHSFGGLFTINTFLNHGALFSNYLAIDPSLDWDDQKLLKQSKNLIKNNSFDGKSLFISLGGQLHMQNKDVNINNLMEDSSEYTLFARSNVEFAHLAESNGINTLWKFYPDELHGSIPLPSLIDGLKFLFDWFPIQNTELFNNPDTPGEKIIELIRNRESKLLSHFGYSIPPFEEDLLNMLGYMNLEWGNNSTSLEIFKLNIEYYPNSANAYDSLADYFISQNDIENAMKNLKKAFEISGSEDYLKRIEEINKEL
jgi:predicted alpha/beta superfamily hydrolase